jgi:ABC-type antimicrobial peptide transport system permease subunit
MQAGNEDYFRVMGTRILRGRAFTTADRANAPRVTIVSEHMAQLLWPNEDAIGKCIRIGADTMPCTTVVGIAEDLHVNSLSSTREFTYYVPMAQYDDASTSMLLLRVAGDASRYAETLRHALQPVMPGAAYVTTMPLREAVDPRMQSWRLGAVMFTAFGALALFLAAIGLYGVVAYAVVQRRREMGIRIALGARPSQVLRLVLAGGIQLVALGILLGSAIAAGSGRLMTPLLFGESPTDPVVYLGVTAVLLIVSLVACSVPALAATRIDPGMTIRSD